MLQKFTVDIQQITQEVLNVQGNANGLTFINKGAATVFIENFPLAQFESIDIVGNSGEICTKSFNIKGNTLGALWVIRKTYL